MIVKNLEEFLSSRVKSVFKVAALIAEASRIRKNRRIFLQAAKNLSKQGKRKSGNKKRSRAEALAEIDGLSDSDFKKIFRVDRETFREIEEKIKPKIETSATAAMHNVKNNMGEPISVKTRLLCTLRYLAGGMFWDICLALKVGFGSFFGENGVLWPTMYAIDESYEIGLPLNDPAALERQASEFAALSKGAESHWGGCLMAIDGWVCETRKPSTKEVRDVMAYRNRKGLWGIVVLAGCDARTKFCMWSCQSTGSTNDISAWKYSTMKQLMDQRRVPPQYYFIGDEAFTCEEQFLSPWGGQSVGVAKDAFNYHLSARRQVIERAFGILTKRWCIFSRPLTCSVNKWTLVATVAAKLHNICIEKNVPILPRFTGDLHAGDAWNVYLNVQPDDREYVTRAVGGGGRRRAAITELMSREGIRRPRHAITNSRA
jgi:hypothetical protein